MKKIKKFIRKIIVICILVVLAIVGYIIYDGYKLYQDKISEISIEKMVEQIQSKDGYLTYSDIPEDFSNALVCIEDRRFFKHSGIDVISISRAMVSNFKEKKLVEGGSTITQQLAKNMYFEFDKKFARKVAEVFVVRDLEEKYSKEEILAMYINIVYFGEGYYGLSEASKGYFKKDVDKLNYDEITMLAGLPNAPSVYNPVQNPDLAVKRQELVKEAVEKYINEVKKK